MPHRLDEIARAIGAVCAGNGALQVTGVAEPAGAGPTDLAMALKPEFAAQLGAGQARAAVMWEGADWAAHGLQGAILPRRPRHALAEISQLFDPGQHFAAGIHPSAVIDPSAELGADVHVGPLSVIGPRARIGAGTVIGPQVFVGADAQIGPGGFLREQVSIGARARIGARVHLQPGVRLGGDGFSFVTPEVSGVEAVRASLGDQGDTAAQAYVRIHSLGAVSIGDDVEIGANSTIDNGTVRDTIVGDRTKIDNLVQIGHNVILGEDCLICAHAAVAGSARIGNHVVLGGKAGVSDNIVLGDRVIVGGGSIVLSNVPAGRALLGYPATKMDAQIESYKALRRLPRLMRDVAALQKAVFKRGDSD